MDYYTLLDMSAELGYQLSMSGAETFRVEESIVRVLQSYNIKGEVFAIPNCLHVSIEAENGKPMTRMRRIGSHGNDLDAVEKYNSISRRICSERPEPKIAAQWIDDVKATLHPYPLLIILLGHILVAMGFALLFGGGLWESLCAGICGLVVGLVNKSMERLKVNPFFNLIIASFAISIIAYLCSACKLIGNADATIIGTLMLLVPGLLFTNALRDIIYGDTNSGTNRIVQVLLIAAAIALGTGTALNLSQKLEWTIPEAAAYNHDLVLELIASFIGSLGFVFIFNIHGAGSLLCAAGGIVTWLTYRCVGNFAGDIIAYFVATMAAALYAEILARIRKYPTISYLVVSLICLIPGAGVYYTVNHIVRGNVQQAAHQGTTTLAIAGAIAVGILLISTLFRLIVTKWHHK